MSTIYKHLVKEDIKTEKSHPTLLPPEITSAPSLGGIKVAIVSAFLLSFLALGIAGYLFAQLRHAHQERIGLEASLVQLRERSQSFELQSDQYRREITRMREQIKSLTSPRHDLKSQLDEHRREISNLQEKFNTLQERNQALEQRIQELRPPVTSVQAGERESVVAAPAGGATATANPPLSAKTAQVMTVNRKFNFIVTNLGMADNLKLGDVLLVERGGQQIGQVQVEKLYDHFAAATIMDEKKNNPIREGDLIVRP